MNFALILFILTVITGIFWIFERTVFLPQRRRKAEEAASAFEAANREALGRGDAAVGGRLRTGQQAARTDRTGRKCCERDLR